MQVNNAITPLLKFRILVMEVSSLIAFPAVGIPAFLSNLTIAGWIKFKDSPDTAMVISIIMGASLIVFLVTYYLWASHLVGKEVDLFKVCSV